MSKFRDFRLKNKRSSNNDNSLFVDIGGNESIGTKSISILIKQARTSGALNLANRNITEIPNDVYKINLAEKPDETSVSFEQSDQSWWDDVFLSKLILTANSIVNISEDISFLDKLSYLDVSDNKISVLPKSLTQLTQLKYLNISKNKIQNLPEDIGDFQEMQQLLCTYNGIKSLPSSMMSLISLTNLDLSHNELTKFPGSIEKLHALNQLDLSYNQISTMPFTLGNLQKLQVLNLSQNKLQTFCEGFRAPVQQLWLHVNRLTNFPIVSLHDNLKEISLTHNMITSLTEGHLSNMPNLCTLTIANNKITDLPENISTLNHLANLDLSNNDLKTLPLSLGNMDQLSCLSIDGNPFRLIKRTVINGGADAIKRFLRMRNTNEEADKSFGPGLQSLNRATIKDGSVQLDQTDLRATGIVRLSSKNITELSEEILNSLESVTVKGINLSGNKIVSFPTKLYRFAHTLYDLDLSNNHISELPSSITSLQVLNRLDVSYNKIRCLPETLTQITTLTHLLLSYNELGAGIPDVVGRLSNLQTLALSHCGLTVVEADKIRALAKLEVLDISNNNIGSIPAELGLCEKIKSLNIDGNLFKVPRPTVIAKGTASVMEYLRSRIVTNQ